jgi:pimeloyl-ACP methyl ester carboxylesterase
MTWKLYRLSPGPLLFGVFLWLVASSIRILKNLRNLLIRAGTAAPLAIKYGLWSRLNPPAAVRSAAKLWCLLPRNAGRKMDNRPGPGSVERVATDPAVLAVELWGPPDGRIVYLVHGWGGWRGQLGAFVAPLAEAGFRVIGFDAASHGDSTPGRYGPNYSAAPEMRRSFEAVVRHYGQPWGIVAHSLGCATVTRALRESVTTTRLAFVAPSLDMGEFLDRFAGSVLLSPKTVPALHEAIEEWAGEPLAWSDPAVEGAGPGMPDVLVIQDLLDKEVPFRAAEAIVENWEKSHLVTTKGLGHHRILKDPGVVERVTQEMSEN